MARMKRGLDTLVATPAEQRLDRGGSRPNLGRGLSSSLQTLGEILGPQADIKAMVDESKRATEAMKRGDIIDSIGSLGLAAVAPLGIVLPGSVSSVRKASENISIFPKPERMFPEGQRPKGGEYLNPKTGDVLTNKNVGSANISITPEGKPKFSAGSIIKETVGSPSTKGATQIKTNLFKKSAGWKWLRSPKKYKDIPTLVSVQNKGKHYYALEANFPEGVNLTRYADSPSEPRLRPTVKGFVDLGKKIGKISVRGKEHPVYDKIINRYAGGSVMERNPYNRLPRAI